MIDYDLRFAFRKDKLVELTFTKASLVAVST